MPLALAFMTLAVVLSVGLRGVEANTIPVGGGIGCTLVQAINAANADSPAGVCAAASGADVLELHGDVTLFAVDNTTGSEGNNGLPAITTPITINGNGFTIQRHPSFGCPGGVNPDFRIFYVTKTGTLTLNDVTVRNGCTSPGTPGGAILDHGSVTINRSTIVGNRANFNGGGVYVFSEDGPTPAVLTVTNSTIADNSSSSEGGGLFFGTTASGSITNSTLKGNTTGTFGGAVYVSGDNVSITSSTIAGNTAPAGQAAGVAAIVGDVTLLSVILDNPAGNCFLGLGGLGHIVSLGYNLATDFSCSLTGTGDMAGVASGLGPYLEHFATADTNGDSFLDIFAIPGSGHFPLLAGSFAINSANGVCPDTDQLGHGRVGNCDRGAIESGVTTTQTLTAVKDSSLFADSVNTNEGVNPRLHLRAAGKRRVVLGFDLATVDLDAVVSAHLVLTIAANSNDWTGSNNLVDAHPLLTDFVEGNGAVAGVPAPNRGSGPGVTWKCATDTQIANAGRNCATVWNGGLFDPPTAPGVVHASGQLGDVAWNVTADIQAGQDLWLIKKRKETAFQPGGVRYYSREGSLNAFGNLSRAPRLILELR